ncbi:sulfur carrier protein ThiS [Vibrio pelagius]|uniref:sulfur carrier protein ThiS n=1 Tax=Vibrio pelagius TaxID=28169 RepID=UPI0021C4A852|nr:sulfur carrier protein ThiS [Vibrio pelagius]
MTLLEQASLKGAIEGGQMITIVINEQPQQIVNQSDLQKIIHQFELPEMGCVFAINNTVIPRGEWGSTLLSEGDSISLFQAIAGG